MGSLRVRLVVSLCGAGLAALAVAASAATSATTYYASPAGVGATECTKSAPCTLAGALSAAPAGSTVQLAPGTYQVSSALTVSKAIAIRGATGSSMPRIIGVASLTKDLLALSGGASISAVHLRSEAPGRDALDLTGASGEDLILEETATAPEKAGHPPAAADLVASSAGTVLRDSVAWGSGTGTEGVIARSGKTASAFESIVLVNDTLIGSGTGGDGLLSQQTAGVVAVANTILLGAAGDVAASPAGVVRIASSDFRPAGSSGYTDVAGNVSATPLFGAATSGDFRELAGSPTVDAGASLPTLGATDPDGNPRSVGAATDIGAYEYVPAAAGGPGGTKTASGTTSPAGATVPNGSTMPTGGALPTASTPPAIGRLETLEAVSGAVLVKLPSSRGYAPLTGASTVALGSIIDASRGSVRVTTALGARRHRQSLTAWGGVFQLSQSTRGAGMTRIILAGAPPSCAPRAAGRARAASARRARSRKLWAKDQHGQYSTYGANSVATVLGTEWETIDSCAGTLTRVLRGKVRVRDKHLRRTVVVRAGHSYLARR